MTERQASEHLIVVKLGGSAITLKDDLESLHTLNLRRLLRKLLTVPAQLILVHGGGSFGHISAKKFRVSEGLPASTTYGASLTMAGMSKLNLSVCEAMLSMKASPAPFPPHAVVGPSGRLTPIFFGLIDFALHHGFIPVVYGDVVFDGTRAFRIVSGDYLAAELAIRFNARHLIYYTSEKGVFSNYPPRGQETPLKTVNQFTRFGGNSRDATGGMSYKVGQALRAAKHGSKTFIISVGEVDSIEKVIDGSFNSGTQVIWSRSRVHRDRLK